jgi:hypothetical protein
MRLGLAAGLAAGYYLGTKAGRERYEELQQLLAKVKRSEAFETAAEKAKAAVDLGVERAREVVEEHKPGNGSGPSGMAVGDVTGVPMSGTPGTPPSGTTAPGGHSATSTAPSSPGMPSDVPAGPGDAAPPDDPTTPIP